ncbi:MAG TPA: hypothetical protein VIZ86_16490 [Pseudomonas sp.]
MNTYPRASDFLHTIASKAAERQALDAAAARFLASGGKIREVEKAAAPARAPTERPFLATGSTAAIRMRRAARDLDDEVAPIVARMRGQEAIVIARYLRTLGINMKSERIEQIAARELIALAYPTKPAGNKRNRTAA